MHERQDEQLTWQQATRGRDVSWSTAVKVSRDLVFMSWQLKKKYEVADYSLTSSPLFFSITMSQGTGVNDLEVLFPRELYSEVYH